MAEQARTRSSSERGTAMHPAGSTQSKEKQEARWRELRMLSTFIKGHPEWNRDDILYEIDLRIEKLGRTLSRARIELHDAVAYLVVQGNVPCRHLGLRGELAIGDCMARLWPRDGARTIIEVAEGDLERVRTYLCTPDAGRARLVSQSSFTSLDEAARTIDLAWHVVQHDEPY